MFTNGTSAPVRRTIYEPERTDNPFVPALPAPSPERWVPLPEWLQPEWLPQRETVPAPRKGVRA